MTDWNYLTRREAKQSLREGSTEEDLQDQFKISKKKLKSLLSGKIKKYKIPKNSMWYEMTEKEEMEYMKL